MSKSEPQRVRTDLGPWAPTAKALFSAAVAGVVVANVANAFSILQEPWRDPDFVWWLLDSERNPSTWLSSSLLLSASLLAVVCRTVDVPRRAAFWAGSAIVLAAASMEEIASAHERVDSAMGSVLSGEGGSRAIGWVLPGIGIAVVIAVLGWRQRPRLPRAVLLGLAAGCALYLAGAAGLEVVGGHWASSRGQYNAGYLWLTTLEENLEFAGSLVVLWWLGVHAKAASSDEVEPDSEGML